MKIIDRFITLPTFNPFRMEWLTLDDKQTIWLNYLYNHSGQKEESSLLENYIFDNVSENKLTHLIDIINIMFNDKWNRLHDALTLEYGVIDNYNRIEDSEVTTSSTNNTVGTIDNTDVMTGGHSENITENDTGSHSTQNANEETENTTITKSEDKTHSKSAYDVDVFSNDNMDEIASTENITKTNNKSLDETHNYSDDKNTSNSFIYNDETKTTSGNSTTDITSAGTNVVHSEIKGNIGVTTSQQMLTSEIELRKFNLINEIYNDLDTILTIGVYVY